MYWKFPWKSDLAQYFEEMSETELGMDAHIFGIS